MIKTYNEEELKHYGVIGMKWGVRRNARVLATHRRNSEIKKAKKDYKHGRITNTQKKSSIKEARVNKKSDLKKMRSEIKNTKDRKDFKELKRNIAKQTVNEVPLSKIKKGATTVNKLLAGGHIIGGATSAAIGIAAAPPLAGALITGAAIQASAEIGVHYLAQLGIDRLT